MAVKAEVINDNSGFFHRLVEGEQHTSWAPYSSATYLNGVVGITPFFHGGSDIELITPERYCELTCAGSCP